MSEPTVSASLWHDLRELIDLWEPFMSRLHLIGYGLAGLVALRHGLLIGLTFAAFNLFGRLWWSFCRRFAGAQAAGIDRRAGS